MSRRELVQGRVVEGEANESDSEEEEGEQSTVWSSPVATSIAASSSAVYSGEAAETDESEEEQHDSFSSNLPPLLIEAASAESDLSKPEVITSAEPKYDTLLHRKLRERNIGLYRHVSEKISEVYSTAIKEVTSASQQLTKSQGNVQDVANSFHLLNRNLKKLEEKIDIIATCQLLPDIKLNPVDKV